MRRVSSRQRLVSWDAFEANEIYSSDKEDRASHNSVHGNVDDIDNISAGYETAHSSSSSEYEVEVIDDIADNEGLGSDLETDLDLLLGRNISTNPSFDTQSRKRDRSALKKHRSRKSKDSLSRDKGKGSSHAKDLQEPTLVICSVNRCDSSNNLSISKSTSVTSMSSFATAVPNLIPGYSWEFSQPIGLLPSPPSKLPTFDSLVSDVHLDIFAFCDLATVRTILILNRKFRNLVQSEDSQTAIWLRHCRNKWSNSLRNDCTVLPTLVDRLHLPTAVSSEAPQNQNANANVNLSLLLAMTPSKLPTGTDESLLNVQKSRRNWRLEQQLAGRGGPNQRTDATSIREFATYNDEATGLPVVLYLGPIGAGDRCIRSNFPLPRPQFINRKKDAPGLSLRFGGQFMEKKGGARNFLKFLRRGSHMTTSSSKLSEETNPQELQWRPFVSPFIESSSRTDTPTINITPRLVSYYEVSILSQPLAEDDVGGITQPRTQNDGTHTRHASDCVAVGLATESFHIHSRMPGWDRRSYGFHGDDGGLFHSSGTMVRPFGERFGAGDTVGCGVDFSSKSIFFTLNGIFLGNGWTNIDDEFLKNDFFPIVGVDTNCPIHLNLGGETPFAFDLSSFIMKDEKIISSNYSLTEETNGSESSIRRASNPSSLASSARSLGASSHSTRRKDSARSPPRRRLSLGSR
eukprot:CAMPEP_0113523220 /NCGR_PEP_ID=MMETSP0014_2-20120614/45595_1 /TAXON_ID=2857 /ORGANISM="Nitzschia sp." /LENGTH=687 /DNA_ID=CAMNT_0000421307 /DNA_START=147 /DNA_END=2210 /DNA_ORIENTATION=- /assembly_acc=CAM_ASM_000159